ncbi:tetratricopeptide repeat protein [Streptacidiphilus rugosus]|uniref:tetratricopeptide repeat protein n=1 Tax=Streptacidiphilus rugosus TaxID=405783 RepID=UPI00056D793E|nr:hypothetical protein [Streptacidiphilus rugosus]
MDADELARQARTETACIPPQLVARLVELGHGDEVAYQATRGEWFCAREYARLLAGQDRHPEALELLAPYLHTGWWTAAETAAGLLADCRRAAEAIALTHPHAASGYRPALEFHARLLARHGRGEEAFALLVPLLDDGAIAAALVDAARDAGRDQDAAALLAARVEAGHHCDNAACRRTCEPHNAVDLLAAVRERQGRTDEAVALLRTRRSTPDADHDQLADLLAHHDRIEELRAYAAVEDHGFAAQRLAELLERRGDVDGAVAAYRQPCAWVGGRRRMALRLSELLARHGRGAEAVEVLRRLADSPDGEEHRIIDRLCDRYAAEGRPEDGLAYLDGLTSRRGEEEWETFRARLRLIAAAGRPEEALGRARAHRQGGTWYAAPAVAELLKLAGRPEEAVTVLRQQLPATRVALAEHLVDLGRVREAVAVLQD